MWWLASFYHSIAKPSRSVSHVSHLAKATMVEVLAPEDNTCTDVVLCETPEPLYLIYMRERWWDANKNLTRPPDSGSGSSEEEEEEEVEVNPLLLDPVLWKEQDHYVILGLSKLRYKATTQDIRKAYRQKVLTHHPDKQTEEQQKDGDEMFKCIKIAYDILWDPKKRRSFDSVDPTFDDTIPTVSSSSKEHFYTTFGPAFLENSRWSTRQPVPQLGNENSPISDVENFYSFWFNIDSWREFSYLDEENSEKGECREERRWMEKQNKAVRQKKKKEDMARLRTLVDNAYTCDPRVKKFKEEEKARKEAKKKAKVDAAKREAAQRAKEEERRLEQERIRQEKEEEEARLKAAQAKKEKDVLKKMLKKEKKLLRGTCKEYGYFANDDSEIVQKMQDLDMLCLSLSCDALKQLNEQFSRVSMDEAKVVFEEQVAKLNKHDQEKLNEASQSASASEKPSSASPSSNWSTEDVQLLVKAVNLFPAGTVRRWDTIATFINTHSTELDSKEKNAKMVITKVKSLQKLESDQKETLNKHAYSRFEQQHQTKEKGRGKAAEQPQATPSERYDAPRPWTAEEQKLLEKSLRTHPASLGAERWNRIAKEVGSRTKEECMARFKELVNRIKAKKKSTAS